MSDRDILPPTPLARQFVRLLVGFTVGVGVGAAPFLGTVNVPLFKQLVDVFPNEDRDLMLALGAFAMGLVAVAVQFYAGESSSRTRVRRLFARTLTVIVVALLALGVLLVKFVEQKAVGRGEVASFAIARERLAGCSCDSDLSNEACLSELTADPAILATCWDPGTTDNVDLALLGSYLLLTSGFGSLIGLLLLQRVAKQQAAARKRSRTRRKTAERGRRGAAAKPKLSASEAPEREPELTAPPTDRDSTG
jgi:hypothetical protein